MKNKKWKFNPITGTMEPLNIVAHQLTMQVSSDDVQRIGGKASVPVIKSGHSLMANVPTDKINMQAIEGEVTFKERSDLSVLQITDYDTNRVMGYIAGYGLDINFNMEELNSVEKVEQFLEGLKKAFRSVILEKALGIK